MKLVLQPQGSDTCGQACIAMIAGISLNQAIEAIGHEGPTRAPEIIRALRSLGITCASRLRGIPSTGYHPRRAMIRCVNDSGSRAHWILAWDGETYDPDPGPAWVLASYLRINS